MIDHGILTKGLTPAIISFVEAANNLFTSNTMTVMYTPEQKLAYFNSAFFTDTIQIKNYIYLVYEYSWKKLQTGFSILINEFQDPFLIIAAIIMSFVGIMLFIMPKWYSNRV